MKLISSVGNRCAFWHQFIFTIEHGGIAVEKVINVGKSASFADTRFILRKGVREAYKDALFAKYNDDWQAHNQKKSSFWLDGEDEEERSIIDGIIKNKQ